MILKLFLRGLLLAALASAALPWPFDDEDGDPPYTETMGIDPKLLDDMDLMAQYSAAAYWLMNSNSTGGVLTCATKDCENLPEDNCPRVEAAQAYTTYEFQNTDHGDDHGYIAIDETNKLVVLAFRGTQSFENWYRNLDFEWTHSDLCKKCKVHDGFWTQWTFMREDIIKNVRETHQKFPEHRLVATGHSLGGALATLAAAELRKIDDDPWYLANTYLFSFGSPRIGTDHTARFLSKQSELTYRVTSGDDPVPHVPIKALGYAHTSPEYYITINADDPKPDNILVCTGFNNEKCISGHYGLDFDTHRHYFGLVRSCT